MEHENWVLEDPMLGMIFVGASFVFFYERRIFVEKRKRTSRANNKYANGKITTTLFAI